MHNQNEHRRLEAYCRRPTRRSWFCMCIRRRFAVQHPAGPSDEHCGWVHAGSVPLGWSLRRLSAAWSQQRGTCGRGSCGRFRHNRIIAAGGVSALQQHIEHNRAYLLISPMEFQASATQNSAHAARIGPPKAIPSRSLVSRGSS